MLNYNDCNNCKYGVGERCPAFLFEDYGLVCINYNYWEPVEQKKRVCQPPKINKPMIESECED